MLLLLLLLYGAWFTTNYWVCYARAILYPDYRALINSNRQNIPNSGWKQLLNSKRNHTLVLALQLIFILWLKVSTFESVCCRLTYIASILITKFICYGYEEENHKLWQSNIIRHGSKLQSFSSGFVAMPLEFLFEQLVVGHKNSKMNWIMIKWTGLN